MTERTDERLGKAINDYLNHYVLVIDSKAAAIAAAALVLIGFVVAPEGHQYLSLPKLLGALFAAIAAVVAGSVLYPRTPHFGKGHFFGAISAPSTQQLPIGSHSPRSMKNPSDSSTRAKILTSAACFYARRLAYNLHFGAFLQPAPS